MKANRIAILAAMLIAAAPAADLRADTRTWDAGGATDEWFDANNWDPDGTPAIDDDLYVYSGSAQFDCQGEPHVGYGGTGLLDWRSGGLTAGHVFIGPKGTIDAADNPWPHDANLTINGGTLRFTGREPLHTVGGE